MIHAVGHILCFQTKSILRNLCITALKRKCFVFQEIARIKLYARKRGENAHLSAALWLNDNGAGTFHRVFMLGKNHAMIVTAGKLHRFIIKIKIPTDGFRHTEIHRSFRNIEKSARRNQLRIGFHKTIRIEIKLMTEDLARSIAAKIKIRVVGKVDHCFLIGCRTIGKRERLSVNNAVFHGNMKRSGIIFLTVGGDIGKGHFVFLFAKLCVPNLMGKTNLSAMQMVFSIITIKRIFLAVQHEFSLSDAVSESADQSALIAVGIFIIRKRVISANNVLPLTVFIGNQKANDGAAKFRKRNGNTVGHDGVIINVDTALCFSEIIFFNTHNAVSFQNIFLQLHSIIEEKKMQEHCDTK